ncbi:MAG: sugar ABC transporter permease [Ruminococcus sp.]|jgi:multiple sugar transport system permease protein|nr:sugar ABC transporter permease [Ruminococcus sp.]
MKIRTYAHNIKHSRLGNAVRADDTFPFLCLLPGLIGVLVFFGMPFLIVIFYSFVDNPVNKEFVFLDNYINLLRNNAFKNAAVNTFEFAVTAVPLAVVLSLFLAFLLNEKIPGVSVWRSVFLSPLMVPVASVVLIWQVVFNQNGTVNVILEHFGLTAVDWFKSDYGMIVVTLLFLWKNLGYNMVLFLAGLQQIPVDLIEVAKLEGMGSIRQFFAIKLRYLSPTILFVAIMSLINSFKVFREVYLLTGDYPYSSLYLLQHFMNNTFRTLDYQKLSSAAVIMGIVMVIIIGTLFIIENRFGHEDEND